MMRKRLTILLGMLALVVGACGGGAATPADSGELVIDLTEFEFNPDNIELKVGQQVTFVLSNEGEKEHEFMIGRDVNTDPGYPNGFEHDFFETTDPVVDPMDALAGMGDMDMDDDVDTPSGTVRSRWDRLRIPCGSAPRAAASGRHHNRLLDDSI